MMDINKMIEVKQRKRPKLGDIFEVETSRGLAYGQYISRYVGEGCLIRIFPGFFTERPTSFSELVNGPDQFIVFFPIGIACNRGDFKLIETKEIPDSHKNINLFKSSGGIDREGKVLGWWLWDGVESWQVGEKLTKEQRRLPSRGVLNLAALISRIEKEHTNETDYIRFAKYYDPLTDD